MVRLPLESATAFRTPLSAGSRDTAAPGDAVQPFASLSKPQLFAARRFPAASWQLAVAGAAPRIMSRARAPREHMTFLLPGSEHTQACRVSANSYFDRSPVIPSSSITFVIIGQ